MTQKRTHIAALIACTLIFGAGCTLLDSANYCKVSFNTNGGNRIKSQKVKIGETLEKPDDPTRDGYEFDAWYYSKNRFDFSTPITEDITLNAYWTFRKADDTPQDGTPPGDDNSEDDKTGNSSGNLEEGDGTGDSTPPGGDNPGDETGNGSGNPEEGDGTGDSGNTDKDDENSTVSYDVYAKDVEEFTGEAYGETTYTLRLLGEWTDYDLKTFGEKIAAITERSVTLDMAEASGSGITTIGDETFRDCASLARVVIGDNVTTIGNIAFYGCTSLESVTIGNSVETIGDFAFYKCQFTSITLPDSVTSIGSSAFSGCAALTSIKIPDRVKSIGSSAFWNCTSLKSITLPDSVETINIYAFRYCTSLKSITIGNGVTSIKDGVFEGCTALEDITIPDSVTSIDKTAFEGCSALKTVTLGAGWVGSNTFTSSSSATALAPFTNCTKVIIGGDKVTEIGKCAFFECAKLESVTISNSVKTIGDNAFYRCEKLASVTISNSVETIGKNAFFDCTSLTTVTIPNSVTSIGASAFNGCKKLKTVTLGKGWVGKTYKDDGSGTALTPFTSYTEVIITEVIIGDGATEIGTYAFYGYGKLASVTIPDSVGSIGAGAFKNCKLLETITFKGTSEQWGEIRIVDDDDPWTNVPATQVKCTDEDVTLK